MTTGNEAQRTEEVGAADELVEYFHRSEVLPQDGALLYRTLLPPARIGSGGLALRLNPGRVRDPRLRHLLDSGLVLRTDAVSFEIGALRIRREGRDLHVACRLEPDGPDTPLFILRNQRSRLRCVSAPRPLATILRLVE